MQLKSPYLAFIFFILVNIGQTFAQTAEAPEAPETPEAVKAEKPFRIGIGLGYSFLGYREETDLPVNRYLDNLNFNLNGNIQKNKFYYSFKFGFLTGETDPLEIKNGDTNDSYFTFSQREAVFLRLYIEHALDYRLWGNSVLPGYLGGALRGDFYYSALKESYYYSLTMLGSLDIHVTQKWIIREGKELVLCMSIPFFGYAIRPPYYGLFYAPLDSEKKITSFHNYRAIFCDLEYRNKISELFSFYFGLGFELSHITFPQPRRDASFCINAGIAFTF